MMVKRRYVFILFAIGCVFGCASLFLVSSGNTAKQEAAIYAPSIQGSRPETNDSIISVSRVETHFLMPQQKEVSTPPPEKQSIQAPDIAWIDGETVGNEGIRDEGIASPADPKAPGSVQERLIDVLRTPFREHREKEAEIDKAIEEYARLGDPGLDTLVKEYYKPRQIPEFRNRAIDVLGKVGTPRARKELLDIALGSREKGLRPNQRAVQAYAAASETKAELKLLLVSTDNSIVSAALRALKRFSLDLDSLRYLKRLTDSKSPGIHMNIAALIEEDPSELYSREKIDILLEGIRSADHVESADSICRPSVLTRAEFVRHRYITALSKMRAKGDTLWEVTERSRGVSHDSLVVALAMKGDTRVKGDLLSFLRSRQSNMLLDLGLTGLAKIGTSEDIPFLRQLSESDPLTRERIVNGEKTTVFPIRETAQHAMKAIQSRPD